MVVVMMMMVVMVGRGHHLRLRCDRSRDAEENEESKQNLFHAFLDGKHARGFISPRSSRSRVGLSAPWSIGSWI
jgi:hypothetical protein